MKGKFVLKQQKNVLHKKTAHLLSSEGLLTWFNEKLQITLNIKTK